jgi:hypothetical protein
LAREEWEGKEARGSAQLLCLAIAWYARSEASFGPISNNGAVLNFTEITVRIA